MDETTPSYYEILGVNQNASQQDIKRAYRRLIKKYFPNKMPPYTEQERIRDKQIMEAYIILSHPEKRQRYDAGEKINPNEDDKLMYEFIRSMFPEMSSFEFMKNSEYFGFAQKSKTLDNEPTNLDKTMTQSTISNNVDEGTESYYKMLNVSPNATKQDIWCAYRRLTQRYHPNKQQPYTEQDRIRDKQLAKAYEVLSDPEKRQRYDLGEKVDYHHVDDNAMSEMFQTMFPDFDFRQNMS